ncbi:hypothetical protein [Micromonospora sp. NPDC002717]|uniref:hypothetical protein n=1 Tax=Micromonospora sp. NPDC002717 TaxID=3154424 RepID=UPI00332C0FF6
MRLANMHRVQRRPACSLPSCPHSAHEYEVENAAQLVQIVARSGVRIPARTRSWPQPGQRPRVRNARSWQVRQTCPSGQRAAKLPRRPQRAQTRMNQRSYCSAVA